VLLVGYEWRRQWEKVAARKVELAGTQWADQGEIDALAAHYEERLGEAGFFFPAHKEASMKLHLRNVWSRMPLTRADVQTFHGMMRQMVRWKERG
jgi:tRNA/rRNA methyltransferase